MAKRKRLGPVGPVDLTPAPEAKSMRAPIADVAGDAAASAALAQLSDEVAAARAGGRMVLTLPLDQVVEDHLVRDRIAGANDDMTALCDSIRQRGQQTPIEVEALPDGRYGLISGWRRCQALRALAAEGGTGDVLALLRQPAEAGAAYTAMVEENEIRLGLSYYERARIAAKAAETGAFDSLETALKCLFETASRPKRSKIRSFTGLVQAFDGHLRFPQAISERLGLDMVKALEGDAGFAERVIALVTESEPATPEAEQSLIRKAMRQPKPNTEPKYYDREIRNGVIMRRHADGRTELRGTPLTSEQQEELSGWLSRALP